MISEPSQLFGGRAGPQCCTFASSGLGEVVTALLASPFSWLWGSSDPGSEDKGVFPGMLNEVCGIQ